MAGTHARIAASCAVGIRDWRPIRWALAFCSIGLVAGCALPQMHADPPASLHAELSEPLGGEALAIRRVDLKRAWHDMVSFQLTLRGIIDRNDGQGVELLDDFLSRYMGEHLDSLLASGWQSSHPELATIDASLRLIKVEMLIDMSHPKRVQRALDDIVERFAGRGGILVEYPVGHQQTLVEAIEHIGGLEWNRRITGTCEEKASLEACLRARF